MEWAGGRGAPPLGAEPYKRVLYAAMRAAFDAGPDLVADAERLLAVLRCEAAKHLAEVRAPGSCGGFNVKKIFVP